MAKPYQEWLKQADYDMDTADYMLRGDRGLYALFMCHLSVEKAIKGLFQSKLDIVPPKIHNLVYLLEKMGCTPPEELGRFIVRLNEVNVATRYPEDMMALQSQYSKTAIREILTSGKEVLEWIKKQF